MLGLYDICPFQLFKPLNKIAYASVICVLLNFEITSFFFTKLLSCWVIRIDKYRVLQPF